MQISPENRPCCMLWLLALVFGAGGGSAHHRCSLRTSSIACERRVGQPWKTTAHNRPDALDQLGYNATPSMAANAITIPCCTSPAQPGGSSTTLGLRPPARRAGDDPAGRAAPSCLTALTPEPDRLRSDRLTAGYVMHSGHGRTSISMISGLRLDQRRDAAAGYRISTSRIFTRPSVGCCGVLYHMSFLIRHGPGRRPSAWGITSYVLTQAPWQALAPHRRRLAAGATSAAASARAHGRRGRPAAAGILTRMAGAAGARTSTGAAAVHGAAGALYGQLRPRD